MTADGELIQTLITMCGLWPTISNKGNPSVGALHQNDMVAHNLRGASKLWFKDMLCTTSDMKILGIKLSIKISKSLTLASDTKSQLYYHNNQTTDWNMIQPYLTFKYSLHSGVLIKQVGVLMECPKETYWQFTKHKEKTQLNQNKGQCPIENILNILRMK